MPLSYFRRTFSKAAWAASISRLDDSRFRTAAVASAWALSTSPSTVPDIAKFGGLDFDLRLRATHLVGARKTSNNGKLTVKPTTDSLDCVADSP